MEKIHYSRNEYRQDYLASDDWKQKSRLILDRDKVCRVCERKESCDTHHLTYERVGFENLETDLIGVCRNCHNRIHRHEELVKISDLSVLKMEFERSKKPFLVKEGVVNQILDCNVATQRAIAGILRIRPEDICFQKNRKWHYFSAQKILFLMRNNLPDGKRLMDVNKHSVASFRDFDTEDWLNYKESLLRNLGDKIKKMSRREILRFFAREKTIWGQKRQNDLNKERQVYLDKRAKTRQLRKSQDAILKRLAREVLTPECRSELEKELGILNAEAKRNSPTAG
jgi:hypothetical protein